MYVRVMCVFEILFPFLISKSAFVLAADATTKVKNLKYALSIRTRRIRVPQFCLAFRYFSH